MKMYSLFGHIEEHVRENAFSHLSLREQKRNHSLSIPMSTERAREKKEMF